VNIIYKCAQWSAKANWAHTEEINLTTVFQEYAL